VASKHLILSGRMDDGGTCGRTCPGIPEALGVDGARLPTAHDVEPSSLAMISTPSQRAEAAESSKAAG
jgi:hypothetical protein